MKWIAFTLTMPSTSSCNWTGSYKNYVVVSKVKNDKVIEPSYTYSFGDGWVAQVKTQTVTRQDAQALRRTSDGFCGYDWMIDSILTHGSIRHPYTLKEKP